MREMTMKARSRCAAVAAILLAIAASAGRAADAAAGEMTFATRAAAEAAVIPPSVQSIRTLGYHEPGRGGATYVLAGTQVPQYSPRGQRNIERPASHYIAARSDSAGAKRYFVLAEESPNVLQFGAIADSSQDGKSTAPNAAAPNTAAANPAAPNASTDAREAFDNTAAFNDAFNYGKSVFVPSGRYFIKGTLRIREDATTFSGPGPGGAGGAGAALFFGPGTANCIEMGDGEEQLRWCKIERLFIDARQRSGGNAILLNFNAQATLAELRIVSPYNGIRIFRGLGFTLRDLWISGIRAGDGTAAGPKEIGYGIKLAGAPSLCEKGTGKLIKRQTQVMYLENISFGSAKVETDPTNWTVGLWCAENSASVNGSTLKNQNVRHGVYITRAEKIDRDDKLVVPDGYRVVPDSWTDTNGTKGPAGRTYEYGSKQYPAEPGTIPDVTGRFQDLTLFYMGGDFLGGEFLHVDDCSGIAIYNPHYFRVYQGNAVYMGPNARDVSIYGGQVIAPYKHCFDMNGSKWNISGVQVYKPSLDEKDREGHRGKFSCVHVGRTSVGGSIVDCRLGNEAVGTPGRVGSTARFGLDIDAGARGTWYTGNRFEGCLQGNVNNAAGDQTQAGSNFLGPLDK